VTLSVLLFRPSKSSYNLIYINRYFINSHRKVQKMNEYFLIMTSHSSCLFGKLSGTTIMEQRVLGSVNDHIYRQTKHLMIIKVNIRCIIQLQEIDYHKRGCWQVAEPKWDPVRCTS
jgi:hypothetical protein